jgi:hypothetical protein
VVTKEQLRTKKRGSWPVVGKRRDNDGRWRHRDLLTPDDQRRNYVGKSLRELQTSLPWTIKHSGDCCVSLLPHNDFAHACHQASKALGQLHGLVDEMHHNGEPAAEPSLRRRYGKSVADLVICALRMAAAFPGGVLDLEDAVVERMQSSNGVTLRRAVELGNSITQTGKGAGI